MNLGHFQDCFNTFTRIFHQILTNDRMTVFYNPWGHSHYITHFPIVCSHCITSVVRVKMFHISKITHRKYTGAFSWRTIWGIAVVRLKIHDPVYYVQYRVVEKSLNQFVCIQKKCILFAQQLFIIKIMRRNEEIVTVSVRFDEHRPQ